MNNDGAFEEFILTNKDSVGERNEIVYRKIMEKKEQVTNTKKVEIFSIKDVEPDMMFTKNTIWTAINLDTLIEFELSGTNIGLMLRELDPIKQLLLSGDIRTFTKNNLYISFKKAYKTMVLAPKKKQKHDSKGL